MKSILKNYRRRLLNLSTSNRALVLLRLSKELHIDVDELDFLNGFSAFLIVQQLITGKSRLPLCPYADSRYARVAPVSTRLRYIRRRSEMISEERGSEELYLGWPFVHGKFADGTAVRCPLLFFPVSLQVNTQQEWELVQDSQQQPHFNQSFLLAYAHYTNTGVAEALMELDWSTMPKDPLAFRTQIYELLKQNQIALHVGSEFFADRVKPFQELKKKELEESTRPGELYIEQEAVVGIFPQAASFLLNDFDALLEQDELIEMENIFSSIEACATPVSGQQAQHTFTAFELDASQEAALLQVKQGKSIVVQGPPGTGKSQLICNMISDFTARGKKVLVVSQKRAALDVVHQRLATKGLHQFAALVHDIHADRKRIFTQILHQIEHLDEYKKENLALNSIQTDRTFLEVCRGINRCTQQLDEFKKVLFDASRCGWSPKELYLMSNPAEFNIRLSTLYKHFTAPVVAEFLPKLRQYLERAKVLEDDEFTWKDRKSFKGWGWPEKQQLEKIIQELPGHCIKLKENFSELTTDTFSLYNLPKYEDALPLIRKAGYLLQEEDVAFAVKKLPAVVDTLVKLKQKVKALEELYLVCPAPDAAIPAKQLDAIEAAIAAFYEQKQHLLKKIGWNFSKEKKELKLALAKYNLELDESGVSRLNDRLALRHQALELIQHLNSKIGYNFSIEDYPSAMLKKITTLKQAIEIQELLLKLHQNKVIHESAFKKDSLPEYFLAVTKAIKNARAAYDVWQKWLLAEQIEKIIDQPGYSDKLLQDLQQHFEHLVAHDTQYSSFRKHERELLTLLLPAAQQKVNSGESLFLNSVYLAWIYELENQFPILKAPSNGELENLEQELQRLLQEKNRLSQEIVLSKLREQTYANIEYNRLGNATTYRRLQVQVSKKRALYPVRKLFAQFQEEILDLLPCWLASPETVSAVLPLQECFDLVIFDEASQCFAEVGIPAIVRGKQVVVAGDSQQLKPSDLYRARWNPQDDEAEELVAESLLQLCSIYLPQVMLIQHYRSLYPELIEFSNQHFYHSRLELIPDKENINTKVPAIQFLRVPGIWQDNTNILEAEKVVELVQELLADGQEEIGVITFNYKQQMLIQDMLEDAVQAEGKILPSSVLVKNIENIQGDEKDIIILSVGYAPDEQGKIAMQFGSLNQAGGENRLNVAVTRARQQVKVVCSIQAEQLQVESSMHQGPKLLKAYLYYAEQVSKGNFAYQPKLRPIPVHATLLKTKMREVLPALKQELPFADLTLKQQGKYVSIVLTDDDIYYSHLSVRQSHADVPGQLVKRSWPFRKVYSREYWADRLMVMEKIRN